MGINRAAESSPQACSADIPVCGFTGLSSPVFSTGDWKVAITRRQECLRYMPAALLFKLRHANAFMVAAGFDVLAEFLTDFIGAFDGFNRQPGRGGVRSGEF